MPNSPGRTDKHKRGAAQPTKAAPKSPRLQFLRGFLKHPVMVGSIIPSSRTVIEKMLAPVDWENTRLFVEYGPGVGTFTRPILEKLRPDATLLTIDTNAEFNEFLEQSIDDKRLVAVTGSAADVEKILVERGFSQADYVLSGIPFSTLPPGLGDAIGEATANVVRPGGAFLVYQFSPKVKDFIEPWFDRIDRGFEWLNVPPASLFWAWRNPPRDGEVAARKR
ncbi:MAG: methyltransferase [Sphingomonas sp.]|nr:methyltransferase [Sphingomonas sp.]